MHLPGALLNLRAIAAALYCLEDERKTFVEKRNRQQKKERNEQNRRQAEEARVLALAIGPCPKLLREVSPDKTEKIIRLWRAGISLPITAREADCSEEYAARRIAEFQFFSSNPDVPRESA